MAAKPAESRRQVEVGGLVDVKEALNLVGMMLGVLKRKLEPVDLQLYRECNRELIALLPEPTD
jgi:hypothetical protein